MSKDTKFCGECGCNTIIEVEEKNNKIKCSSCGAKLTENTKFCPECGDRYNPCPNCKGDMPEGATICPICNEPLPRKCPGCNADIFNKKAKFCSECGIALVKKCGKCSAEIEGEPKFCPECGNKL